MLKLSFLFGLLTLALLSFGQASQEPNEYCATVELSPDQMEFLDYFHAHREEFMGYDAEATQYIPIKVHSVAQDNGFGHMPKANILRIICELNDWYKPISFHFYLYGEVNEVNNSTYYSHTGSFTGSTMMKQYNVSNVLNMYLVNDAAGACGYFSHTGDAIAITKSCAGPGNTTVAHEVGHFFSLPHTFHGWESGTPPVNQRELVDGSNCSSAGDGFCDTPPDYLADRWTCPYSGPVLTDPNGDVVIPDGSFIMSYANDACTHKFSPQQRGAMIGYLISSRNALRNHPVPSLTVAGPSELVFPTDQLGGVPPDNTTFKWTSVDGATHYHLQISRIPGVINNIIDVVIEDTSFHVSSLNSNKTYYWKVEALANGELCSDNNSAIHSFTTSWPTGIEDQDGPAAFNIYPNPASKGQSLTIDFGEPVTDGIVRVINLQGQTLSAQTITGTTMQVPTSGMSSGMYLVSAETEQGTRTERIVLH